MKLQKGACFLGVSVILCPLQGFCKRSHSIAFFAANCGTKNRKTVQTVQRPIQLAGGQAGQCWGEPKLTYWSAVASCPTIGQPAAARKNAAGGVGGRGRCLDQDGRRGRQRCAKKRRPGVKKIATGYLTSSREQLKLDQLPCLGPLRRGRKPVNRMPQARTPGSSWGVKDAEQNRRIKIWTRPAA